MTKLKFCVKQLAVTALLCHFSISGWAQTYPSKPMRYLTGGSTGSGADTLARMVATGLSQALGQQVLVENRPGAGGNLVAELGAKAPPDGYTIFQTTAAYAVYASLYRNLNYDLIRDFSPVTQLATGPYVLVVHPSMPVKSVGELIKLAKGKPGAINYSSAGAGGPTFMAAELFKAQAGVDMLHVPYKGGGPAFTAVIAGEVSVYFAPISIALTNIRERRLRGLGVTTAKRMPFASELPTIAESGLPGFESGNWYGLVVPAKTPRETIATIRGAVVSVLNNPATNQRLNALGFVTIGDQPEEFGAYIKLEVERLGKIVRALKLTPD